MKAPQVHSSNWCNIQNVHLQSIRILSDCQALMQLTIPVNSVLGHLHEPEGNDFILQIKQKLMLTQGSSEKRSCRAEASKNHLGIVSSSNVQIFFRGYCVVPMVVVLCPSLHNVLRAQRQKRMTPYLLNWGVKLCARENCGFWIVVHQHSPAVDQLCASWWFVYSTKREVLTCSFFIQIGVRALFMCVRAYARLSILGWEW